MSDALLPDRRTVAVRGTIPKEWSESTARQITQRLQALERAMAGASSQYLDPAHQGEVVPEPVGGPGGGGGGAPAVHTHAASEITFVPYGDIAAGNVQDVGEEVSDEKLARDGSQTVTGDLDHDHHSLVNVHDADLEGTATVGEDVVLTEGVGGAKITNPRLITMAGLEANAEGRIESVNAVAFNSITPTAAAGKLARDATESTLVFYVSSGASVLAVALGWAANLAVNGVP